MSETCEHLSGLAVSDFPPPDPPNGCKECLVEGTTWVELRECLTCGHVGCCDSSPQTHATKHHKQTQHPVMRSVMPDATWDWCYVHELTGDLPRNS